LIYFLDDEELLDDLASDLISVISCRYLQINDPVPKSLGWLTTVLPCLDEKRFKIMLRITRPQFSMILQLIESHPTFHTRKNRLPVPIQLAVVLFRIGSYGSGCSIPKLATLFGVGDGGTVDRTTRRIFKVTHSTLLIYTSLNISS